MSRGKALIQERGAMDSYVEQKTLAGGADV